MKKRADNLRYAEGVVREASRRMTVGEYIPGQVIYNLGEYPAPFKIRPTEYDYNLIKSLAERGVGLIQIHEEWNDAIRVLGADKYTSHDPEGLDEFIKLCHGFGIKVIPYVSTGFFDSRDPDFKEEFCTFGKYELNSSYYRYRMCDPSSPLWRSFILDKIDRILDRHDFDGIFNDMGYPADYEGHPTGFLPYDEALDSLLSEIYRKVKSGGGIVKIHEGKCLAPKTLDRVYDYLWVGEGVRGAEDMLSTRAHDPYLISCPDFRFISKDEQRMFYASSMSLMQFVLRVDGRPITGERADVPGIDYIYNPQNDEKLHFDKVKRWYDTHPDGPHVYSEWSSIPDDPDSRAKWFDYLDLYRPMVKEGTEAFVDVGLKGVILGDMPDGVHASLYASDKVYMTLANLGEGEKTVTLAELWLDRQSGKTVRELKLKTADIVFLERC